MSAHPKSINIISDIAGRFLELQLLLAKMPQADITIALGDLNDRGSLSKQVIEYFMTTPNTDAIKGNHDQFLVDGCRHGIISDWMHNGGWATIESYGGFIELIPKAHVDWLNSRPLYFDFPDLFLSHAPVTSLNKEYIPARFSQDEHVLGCYGFLWNRNYPRKPLKKFHIFGHNSRYKEYKDGSGKVYAICLDDSANRRLNGIHWISETDRQLYTVDYIETKE